MDTLAVELWGSAIAATGPVAIGAAVAIVFILAVATTTVALRWKR